MAGRTKSWFLKGERVNKFKARDSRWGPGRVHMTTYVSRFRAHGLGCKRLSDLDFILGGVDAGNVPKDEPVTCKNCQKKYGLESQPQPVKRKIRIVRRKKKK